MQTFSIRDLREHTGELVRTAEAGELSVVAKHGTPVFVAVPFSDSMLENGVHVALAIKMFRDHTISIGQATKLAKMSKLKFIEVLGSYGIPAVDYPVNELDAELQLLSE